MYSNDGFEYGREALTDVRRIAVEEVEPTEMKVVPFPITGKKVLEPDGRIVIQQGEKKYGVEGMMIKDWRRNLDFDRDFLMDFYRFLRAKSEIKQIEKIIFLLLL